MFLNSLLVAYQDYWEVELSDGSTIAHYDYPDIWTSFAKDGLQSVFLWAAIVLAAVLLLVGLFVRWKKAEALVSYVRVALSIAVGFSVAVIIAMLSLEFMDMQESGAVFDMVLYPTIVLGACVILGSAAIYMGTLFDDKTKKITLYAALSVMGAALIALLVCLGVYLASGVGEENNGLTITVTENVMLYVSAGILVAVLIFAALFFGRKDKTGFNSKAISYGAICIAMSFALSYLAPIKMPQGGSVTIASLLPLMVYSCMFGVKKGIFVGMIYGILQAVQDPWIIHPAQFLLDYPIAFAGIGISGLFMNVKKLDKYPQVQFALGAILGSVLRYLAHILSGVFAFSEYAYHWVTKLPLNPWVYSLAYNSFVFADIAISIVVGIIMFSSRSFVREVRKARPVEKKEEA